MQDNRVKEKKQKTPWWMCALEEYFWKHDGWELVHNGQQSPVQVEFHPDEVKHFTRHYRNGNRWVRFIYDLRGGIKGAEFKFGEYGKKHHPDRFKQV